MAIILKPSNSFIMIQSEDNETEFGITVGNYFIEVLQNSRGCVVKIIPGGYEDSPALAIAQVTDDAMCKALDQLQEDNLHSHPDLNSY